MLLPLALTLAACGGDENGPVEVELQDPAQISYAPSLGVNTDTMEPRPSGLYVKDLQVGEGDPTVAGDVLVVHYSGWVNDGTLFDSSRTPGRDPFTVTVGAGQVIAGWEEGLLGMRVGGVRQLVIPPQLAYGAQSPSPLIPAGSVLIFEIELLEVNPGS
ncbi:MAG: FKBP-type peptidyl-prolyl cis-trans isomerase [Gammaproteobacteria bacterium]|nr:FKBP-type peptidyl-prolyl cis-trans isomerase [Gammaproteobacteria bacterium]MYI21163.1 FKBP-type peptidyl-prolyl cis-trans isomerase [Gammaproteobacteria bacterium]